MTAVINLGKGIYRGETVRDVGKNKDVNIEGYVEIGQDTKADGVFGVTLYLKQAHDIGDPKPIPGYSFTIDITKPTDQAGMPNDIECAEMCSYIADFR